MAGADQASAPAAGAALYDIPLGRPFLASLARAVLSGDLPRVGGQPPDPLALAEMTILLPTRRAARELQSAFLAESPGGALLLPRIRPIVAADELPGLVSDLLVRPSQVAPDLPPPIGGLERQLALTSLVLAWSRAKARTAPGEGRLNPFETAGVATAASAAALARELCRLMDLVESHSLALGGLASVVERADLAIHWQLTLDFLAILMEHWPVYLRDRGAISQGDRLNRILAAEARRMAAVPPGGPVIVAGVAQALPSVAVLIKAVAALPQGAVVLPGLDRDLDEATWQLLGSHPEHPQHGLAGLLADLGRARADVVELAGARTKPAMAARGRLLSEAMRPPETSPAWQAYVAGADRDAIRAALADVTLIEAQSSEEEAEAIALVLREALETPGRTAALVTPDRALARRVTARLEVWGIRIDDSAGRPLSKTLPGVFLDLVIEAAANGLTPVATMALLKHPLTRLGLSIGAARRAARTLEIAVFRQPYLGGGIEGIVAGLDRAAGALAARERLHPAMARKDDTDLAAARDLVERFARAMGPLLDPMTSAEPRALSALVAAHTRAAEALVRPEAGEEESELWRGEAGQAAATLIGGILDPAMPAIDVPPRDYPDLWRALGASELVRPLFAAHPRLFVWGPLEARLMRPDIAVIGSLNEGAWPEVADPGPWLNRSMRKALGLPAPEVATGRAAHDLVSQLGADRVILTRAAKEGGTPTTRSRWLMRLDAVLEGLGLEGVLREGAADWLSLARRRDHASARTPAARPMPRPALALRPRRLSVSAVERWVANPYALYASRILRLEPLDPLGPAPDQRLRGSLVHEVMARFAKAHPERLPPEPLADLKRLTAEVLAEVQAHPRVAAFWLPRLVRFTEWLAESEPSRRAGIRKVHAEVDGKLIIDAPGGPFTLTARADRIDEGTSGLIVADYKTGQLPSRRDMLEGYAPQLPLEAAIAAAGGFAGLDKGRVKALRFIRATGGMPAGEEQTDTPPDLDAIVAKVLADLSQLVARFDDERTPYAAVRRQGFSYDYDAYTHLARVAEWAAIEGEE